MEYTRRMQVFLTTRKGHLHNERINISLIYYENPSENRYGRMYLQNLGKNNFYY